MTATSPQETLATLLRITPNPCTPETVHLLLDQVADLIGCQVQIEYTNMQAHTHGTTMQVGNVHRISVNSGALWSGQLRTIFHELAHIMCGHKPTTRIEPPPELVARGLLVADAYLAALYRGEEGYSRPDEREAETIARALFRSIWAGWPSTPLSQETSGSQRINRLLEDHI